jgi:hypothetical protein
MNRSLPRKLVGLAFLGAGLLCACLKAFSWDPVLKFTPFGGPWVRLYLALAVVCVIMGATLFLWRRSRPNATSKAPLAAPERHDSTRNIANGS